jgi:hypothetical protein
MAKVTLTKEVKNSIMCNLSKEIKARIPRCTDDLYKLIVVPPIDSLPEDPADMNVSFAIRSIIVDSTVIHDDKCIVNGEFEISLLPNHVETELERYYANRDEAEEKWAELMELQKEKVMELRKNADAIIGYLEDCIANKRF